MPSLPSAFFLGCWRRFGFPEAWSWRWWLHSGLSTTGSQSFWSCSWRFPSSCHEGGIFSDSPTSVTSTSTCPCFGWLPFISQAIRESGQLLWRGGWSACSLQTPFHPCQLPSQVGSILFLVSSAWPFCVSSHGGQGGWFSSLSSPLFVSLLFLYRLLPLHA